MRQTLLEKHDGLTRWAPPPELAHEIESVWSLKADFATGVRLPLRPDGGQSLLFNRAEPFILDGRTCGVGTFLDGATSRPVELQLQGTVDLWSVRFRPGAASRRLGLPASELRDGVIELSALVSPTTTALLGAWMRNGTPLSEVGRAVASLQRRPGLPIEHLARSLGVGRRSLERAFHTELGLSPRMVDRILRARATRGYLRAHPTADLSDLALTLGYADHAHLTREFKRFNAQTPTDYRAARRRRSVP